MKLSEHLFIRRNQGITVALQIKQQVYWLVASGKLPVGEKLPPIRELASQLGLNLHTVRNAYHLLEAEGIVETRPGRGTRVLAYNPRKITEASLDFFSHTIGVIVPSWSNPFYHEFLAGVEEITEVNQSLIFLCNTHDDDAILWRDFSRLAAKQVDGILVASHDIYQFLPEDLDHQAASHNLPVVTVDYPGCRGYGVQIDLESVGYMATRHLVEHGHQRIGLITFNPLVPNVEPIVKGYQRALAEAKLKLSEDLIAVVPGFDKACGEQGAIRLLTNPRPPSAIFACSDLIGLGAMEAAVRIGLRIPEDLAVIGFNNIPVASLVEPGLTSVAAPTVELGREAMKMLQKLIERRLPEKKQISLPVNLVKRRSCGCDLEDKR